MRRIAWIFVLALVMGLVPAMADSWTWTFTDAWGLAASGTLSGSSIGGGAFNITSGAIVENEYGGAGNILVNPSPGNPTTSPSGYFAYDNLLSPQANPLLDSSGLLFVGSFAGGAGTEVNIWGTGTDAYIKYLNNGANDAGTFAIVATPDGGTTLSLLGLAIVGLAGLRRKLSL